MGLKYIHLFSAATEFEAAYNGSSYEEPWLSFTEENERVNYNKSERERLLATPLTFEIVSAPSNYAFFWNPGEGSKGDATLIAFKRFRDSHPELTGNPAAIQYSYNGGEWVTVNDSNMGPIQIEGLKAGDTIQFRGNFPFYGLNPASADFKFSFDPSTGYVSSFPQYKVYGNIMSLTDYNPAVFSQMRTLYYELGDFQTANFKNLFIRCKITDASGLILPATSLTPYCYSHLFYNSTVTAGPELAAATLVDHCYWRMFDGCSSINSINCLATDISATDCTTLWVRNTPASGTFTKAASTNWPTGNNGIPTGWSVVDAS